MKKLSIIILAMVFTLVKNLVSAAPFTETCKKIAEFTGFQPQKIQQFFAGLLDPQTFKSTAIALGIPILELKKLRKFAIENGIINLKDTDSVTLTEAEMTYLGYGVLRYLHGTGKITLRNKEKITTEVASQTKLHLITVRQVIDNIVRDNTSPRYVTVEEKQTVTA